MNYTNDMLCSPEKYVPNGFYCYSRNGKEKLMCPFWSIKPDLPEQENGFCAVLNQSDYERNDIIDNSGGLRIVYCKETIRKEKFKDVSAHAFSASLLWDQCKECKINYNYDEEEE